MAKLPRTRTKLPSRITVDLRVVRALDRFLAPLRQSCEDARVSAAVEAATKRAMRATAARSGLVLVPAEAMGRMLEYSGRMLDETRATGTRAELKRLQRDAARALGRDRPSRRRRTREARPPAPAETPALVVATRAPQSEDTAPAVPCACGLDGTLSIEVVR